LKMTGKDFWRIFNLQSSNRAHDYYNTCLEIIIPCSSGYGLKIYPQLARNCGNHYRDGICLIYHEVSWYRRLFVPSQCFCCGDICSGRKEKHQHSSGPNSARSSFVRAGMLQGASRESRNASRSEPRESTNVRRSG
jgi:hypothetical protein